MLSDNGTVKVSKTGLSFVERQVMSGTCSPIKHVRVRQRDCLSQECL